MPRNVRNFWIDLQVDGKKTPISCGPVRADGGFSATIFIRDSGSVCKAVTIKGSVDDGRLALTCKALHSTITYVDPDALELGVRTKR